METVFNIQEKPEIEEMKELFKTLSPDAQKSMKDFIAGVKFGKCTAEANKKSA